MTTDVTQQSNRFEISVDGSRAGLAEFVDADGRRIFTHTEVDDEYSGKGLAGELVAHALDATREAGLRVVPMCDYVRGYVEKHDEYADLVDPVTSAERTTGSLSNDVTVVAAALAHGLRHYEAGRVSEALWWWQFSYLSDWGERAAAGLRVLQSLLSHIRLDADEESVSEAEFDALHP
jgi:predicted GNAT family acetyltransferase